jgi:hypothetical protein
MGGTPMTGGCGGSATSAGAGAGARTGAAAGAGAATGISVTFGAGVVHPASATRTPTPTVRTECFMREF